MGAGRGWVRDAGARTLKNKLVWFCFDTPPRLCASARPQSQPRGRRNHTRAGSAEWPFRKKLWTREDDVTGSLDHPRLNLALSGNGATGEVFFLLEGFYWRCPIPAISYNFFRVLRAVGNHISIGFMSLMEHGSTYKASLSQVLRCAPRQFEGSIRSAHQNLVPRLPRSAQSPAAQLRSLLLRSASSPAADLRSLRLRRCAA